MISDEAREVRTRRALFKEGFTLREDRHRIPDDANGGHQHGAVNATSIAERRTSLFPMRLEDLVEWKRR